MNGNDDDISSVPEDYPSNEFFHQEDYVNEDLEAIPVEQLEEVEILVIHSTDTASDVAVDFVKGLRQLGITVDLLSTRVNEEVAYKIVIKRPSE